MATPDTFAQQGLVDTRDDWPVYLINMDGQAARLAESRAQLDAQGIAFERFAAVDGRKLPPQELDRVYDAHANRRRFRHPLVGGEIGCYLSHIALWQRIAEGTAAGAIILEDDFEASPELGRILHALARDTGRWDMVKLHTRRPKARVLARRPLCEGADLARPYQIPNTTMGYAIRKEAAIRLLARSRPFSRPIDEDLKRFWEHRLDIRVVLPPPLTPGREASRGETIGAARRRARGPGQALRTLRYRLGYLLALRIGHLRARERRWRLGLGQDISTPKARREAQFHYDYIDHGVLRRLWHNHARVSDGVFRANQPSVRRLAWLRGQGFRTILNLRGESGHSPYLFEREACAALGLTLVNHRLYASRLASREEILGLIDLFSRIELPVLMHCKSGSDRTGFAAVLYLHVIAHEPLESAMRALHWKHLHLRRSKNGILDLFFEVYLEEGAPRGKSLVDWIATDYDPEAIQQRFARERRPR